LSRGSTPALVMAPRAGSNPARTFDPARTSEENSLQPPLKIKRGGKRSFSLSFLFFPFSLLLFTFYLTSCASTRNLPLQAPSPNQAQRDTALAHCAAFKHLGFQVVAARLKLGVDTALAWRQLDTLLAKPTGDIFWMYPATGFYFNCKDQLSDAWRARFRATWKRYTPYRGDTENHFLMYYSSLFLMSQEWPDLPGSEWFNGKSSRENYEEAKEYLNHWIDETVCVGTTEWDSPRYFYYYMTPLILLHDFTRDPAMQRRFEMMLEYQLADFAAEYLNGSYCGAHSRDGDGSVIDPRKAECSSYAQFYFEDSLSFVLPDLAFAAMSSFRCPPIIRAIAHDRSQPFVHTEIKRSRAKIRFSDERYTPVYKYDYMTPDYCLGSMQGGLQQPIQQHSWDITFASDKPNNTIFGLHPQYSATELGTFFPEEPELMVEGVAKTKASYTNENKWIGGSPYEFIKQGENELVALYDIPDSVPFKHVDLFFPKTLDTLLRDTSGWIVCRMGNAFAAIYPFHGKSTWIDEPADMRLRITVDTNRSLLQSHPIIGYVVMCSDTSQFQLFDRFVSWLRWSARPVLSLFDPQDVGIAKGDRISRLVRVLTSNGQTFYPLYLSAKVPNSLLSFNQALSSTALFSGLHLRSELGSGILEMRAGGMRRTLDFVRNEVRE
jgi:hypothetical protein